MTQLHAAKVMHREKFKESPYYEVVDEEARLSLGGIE